MRTDMVASGRPRTYPTESLPIPKTHLNLIMRMASNHWAKFNSRLLCWRLGREVAMKHVAIYLRVSTDKQTTDNQRQSLRRSPSDPTGRSSRSTKMLALAVARAVISARD